MFKQRAASPKAYDVFLNVTYKRILVRKASSEAVPSAAPRLSRQGISYYWDTALPTPNQLHHAEKFFQAAPPKLIYSTTKFRTVKPSSIPEVAFLGRSNVGKSSLLNVLMGQKICHTSSRPGRTRSLNFFAVGGEDLHGNPGKVSVIDMPGYGKGSREEWGDEIMKYLVGRKQLKRAFLLVDALHGLKRSDEEILSLFRKHAVSHQVILSKVDRILFPKRKTPSVARLEMNIPALEGICHALKAKIQPGHGDGPEALGEIITCSGEATLSGKKLGIDSARWAVLTATGLANEKGRSLSSTLPIEPTTPMPGFLESAAV